MNSWPCVIGNIHLLVFQKNGSEMTCIVHGSGRQKKTGGSMYLHFQLRSKHLDRLITLFAKLEAYDTCNCLHVLVCMIAFVV